jgi:hypothetical protein
MPEVVTRGLRHITSVSNALLIAETGVFHSGCKAQSYDGGMNFLGVLGENSNTQPRERGAELLCSWIGKVSAPLLWDEPVTHEENKLLDFNGSGNFRQNNDPRYLLPVGSVGLRIDRIVIHDLNALVDDAMSKASAVDRFLYQHGWLRTFSLDTVFRKLAELNCKCARGKVTISVQ